MACDADAEGATRIGCQLHKAASNEFSRAFVGGFHSI
jgi:hypothetical protein